MATRIYTKTGDKGSTALFGGQRVQKDDLRIQAYGTVDELNSVLGVALTCEMNAGVADELRAISSQLFSLGSDLATPLDPPPSYEIPRITEEHIVSLERQIDAHDEVLQPLTSFILPGGTPAAAQLHLARTVCRRAERLIVALGREEDIGDSVLKYVNRLSDYLFTAARAVNHHSGVPDVPWQP